MEDYPLYSEAQDIKTEPVIGMANRTVTTIDKEPFLSRVYACVKVPSAAIWLGLTSVLIVIGAYNLIFFNKFFPLTEGWFSAYAHLLNSGKTPYKDFYLFLPPLYPLQLAVFTRIFGEGFIALRILGIGLILSMSGCLYLIYSRWFSPYIAAFATIVSIAYYQCGTAHIPYDFTQFLTAYAVFSTFAIILHCELTPTGSEALLSRNFLYAFIAGFLSSLAFFTKQSNGAFIALFSGIAVAIGTLDRDWRYSLKSSLSFIAGAAIPTILISIWLLSEGAVSDFVNQVYFGAVQSKGSMDSILFSWTKEVFTNSYYVGVKTILKWALALLVANLVMKHLGAKPFFGIKTSQKLDFAVISLITLIGLLSVLVPLHAPLQPGGIVNRYGLKLWNHAVVISTLTVLGCFLAGLVALVIKKRNMLPGPFALATVSLGLIIGNGTSGGIGEISCFLGLGLFIAAFMSLKTDIFIGKAVLLFLGFSFLAFLASKKYDSPYSWWNISQPAIRSELYATNIPELEGFRLSKDTLQIFNEIKNAVITNTAPDDSILAFPHMPIFYLLSDRWPNSMAVVHWFDFLPDDKARTEAAGILQAPPRVIINMDLPESVWEAHERLFRHGRHLGQRDTKKAIEQLVFMPNKYKLINSYTLPNYCVLKVWLLQ